MLHIYTHTHGKRNIYLFFSFTIEPILPYYLATMSPRVTVQSVLTTVSSKPAGSGLTHPLSTLDHAMGLHTVHLIFYYDHNVFGSFELDPMRESLSEVLSLYPMVTGRLARGRNGNLEIMCNDAGIRVIKATVDTSLHEWLRSADAEMERHLTAWDDMPNDFQTWSPFRIQINGFEGGGVAVGVSCSHLVADITWASSFFRCWTRFHRHLPITLSSLSLPRTTASNPNPHPNPPPSPYYASRSSSFTKPPSKLASATFRFSGSAIHQCLSQLPPTSSNVTPFDFLSALFWTRISSFKTPRNDPTPHSLSICIDVRSLLKSPPPSGYFGNALHFSLLSLEATRLETSNLGDIVDLIHTHVEAIGEQHFWSTMEWFESQGELEGGKFIAPTCMYGPELTCVSMEHMINGGTQAPVMYEAMFREEEKPVHVSCHVGNVEGEGLVMVMPSPEGGLARTVTLTLPEEELRLICEDQAILQLHPTAMLNSTPLSHSKRNISVC